MIQRIFTVCLLAVFVLISCGKDKNNKAESDFVQPESTGRINHLVAVVEPHHWKSGIGNALKDLVTTPVTGLPQQENQFKISTVPSKGFKGLFRNSRNILVTQVSDQEVFHVSKNKYAKPQTIVVIKAKTEKALEEKIREKSEEIAKVFKDEDLKSIQKLHHKERYRGVINTLKKQKANLVIPNKYRVVMDTLGSFLWMRSHIAGGIAVGDQTNNILVYSVPMFDTSKSITQQVIKNRDSIGKLFIRGNDVDKMYMITEAARKPVTKILSIDGKRAFETRGTWEVYGAFNAGPFLNYSIEDPENNRVLVVEGFNYAPSVNKRDFVFELEAILKTASVTK